MGTRWRGLLAPIGVPTGDGRRFAQNSITHRALPLGLKWQRSDEMAHDTSVVVGSVDVINFGTVTEAVEAGWIDGDAAKASGLAGDTMGAWGQGEVFDDVSAETMPRMAEDVAEAVLLTSRGVIGPSVDAGMAEAILAEPGSDEPVSEERLEELWDEAWENGTPVELETVFTTYEIAAATLVTVPAFAQCLPFTLDPAADGDTGEEEGEGAEETAAATVERVAALVAAAGTHGFIEAFSDPELSGITPITITDPDAAGVRRVFGHVAAFGVCHVGIRDACTTAPQSAQQYAPFHRYLETATGHALPVAAGRITVAHGSLTGKCRCCPGIDDHACNRLSMGATIGHYDNAAAVAYVRAGDDGFGIWIAGVIAPEATEEDIAALARQKVSGDWRDVAGSLELLEVLTLNREKPGFPLPRAAMANGRQMSLVAAGTVTANRSGRPGTAVAKRGRRPAAAAGIDYDKIGAAVATALAPFAAGWGGAVPAATITTEPPAAGPAPETAPDSPQTQPEGEPQGGVVPAAAAAAEALSAFTSALTTADAAVATADLERSFNRV